MFKNLNDRKLKFLLITLLICIGIVLLCWIESAVLVKFNLLKYKGAELIYTFFYFLLFSALWIGLLCALTLIVMGIIKLIRNIRKRKVSI